MFNHPHRVLSLIVLIALSLLSPRSGTAASPEPITIISPGDGSVVINPIQFNAEFQPQPKGLLRITLVDRNNALLTRQLFRMGTPEDDNATIQFTTWLPFEIPENSTQALLTLATTDSHHQTIALRTASLTLLTEGTATITANSQPSWLTITTPAPMETISGGNFVVEGTITAITQKPIIFELTTEKGAVIGAKQLAVEEPGNVQSFKIPLSYTTTITRTVRLVIRQTIDPYAANVILDSLPVILNP